MINTTHPDIIVPKHHLQSLLYDKNKIKALACQIVAGHVEAHLDMISDAGVNEYKTFQEVADCIQGAKESVKDYLEDLLHDFRETLYEEVAKVKIDTKAMILKPCERYSGGVEIDADVDVSIE